MRDILYFSLKSYLCFDVPVSLRLVGFLLLDGKDHREAESGMVEGIGRMVYRWQGKEGGQIRPGSEWDQQWHWTLNLELLPGPNSPAQIITPLVAAGDYSRPKGQMFPYPEKTNNSWKSPMGCSGSGIQIALLPSGDIVRIGLPEIRISINLVQCLCVLIPFIWFHL